MGCVVAPVVLLWWWLCCRCRGWVVLVVVMSSSVLLLLRHRRCCYCLRRRWCCCCCVVVAAFVFGTAAASAVFVVAAIIVAALVLAVATRWDGSPRRTAPNPSAGFVSSLLGWSQVTSSFDMLALGTRVVSGVGWDGMRDWRKPTTMKVVVRFPDAPHGPPTSWVPLVFLPHPILRRTSVEQQ